VIFYEATTNTAWATASALGTIVLGIVGMMLVVSAIVIRHLMPWQSVNQ